MLQPSSHPAAGLAAPVGVVASPGSAVSWGAVLAGAVIGAALSAMLLTVGSGLGFLAISPWRNEGASGTALAIGSIVWLFATQIVAFGVAGYVAGRLRTRWTDGDRDEIFFRDTAHGLLVWAVSAVAGLVLIGSTVSSVVSGTAQAGATLVGAGAGAVTAVAGQAVREGADDGALAGFTDTLLRPENPMQAGQSGEVREEVTRLLARGIVRGEWPQADRDYLVRVVAAQADVDEATARARVEEISAQAQQAAREAEQTAREAADAARKAAAAFALWAFAALLLGAFVASVSATMGGRARDR